MPPVCPQSSKQSDDTRPSLNGMQSPPRDQRRWRNQQTPQTEPSCPQPSPSEVAAARSALGSKGRLQESTRASRTKHRLKPGLCVQCFHFPVGQLRHKAYCSRFTSTEVPLKIVSGWYRATKLSQQSSSLSFVLGSVGKFL